MSIDTNGSTNAEVVLTREGARKLEEELQHLKVVERPKVAEELQVARAHGDLSENAEYDEAKRNKERIENNIRELEYTLLHARIVDVSETATDVVSIGNVVRVYDEEFEEEIEYTLVGATEGDPSLNRVSNESPIGRALLGAHVGDVVDVQAPFSTIKLKVLSIRV